VDATVAATSRAARSFTCSGKENTDMTTSLK
jgi:hypothetical protein